MTSENLDPSARNVITLLKMLAICSPFPLFAFAPAHASTWPPATGLSIYPGCATPPTTSGAVFYIDPVNGSPTGNGSSANPWNSLQALVTSINGASPLLSSVPYWHATSHGWSYQANTSAPVKPGDTVLLMSGNYGDFSIDIYQQNIYNSAFVTIANAPGQKPVLSRLHVGSTNKWLFKGLTVNGLANGYDALVTVQGQSVASPSYDIVFDTIDVASTADVSGWSAADWISKGRMAGIEIGDGDPKSSRCTTVRGSSIENVRFGALLAGYDILFTRNKLNNLGDDFIDYAGSNITITYNRETNSNTLGDLNHNDFMQGQLGYLAPGVISNQFQNILIDSNYAMRQTSPASVKFPGEIQGIDAFDSDWTSVTVSNNVVITSTCQGISFYSLHGGLVVNNTLVDDNSGYGTKNAQGVTVCRPTINVAGSSHEGSPSNNVTIRNNIAPGFSIANTTASMAMDHNICASMNGACQIAFNTGSKTGFYSAPGVYGDGALIAVNTIQSGQTQNFALYDPTHMLFDLHLAVASPLLIGGNKTLAPVINIEGATRTTPPSIGAY